MGCTMIATLMQALDNTIANVALPHMQGTLGASRDQITWVLTSYVIAAADPDGAVGWFAARFGRKQFFDLFAGRFTVTSMACGWRNLAARGRLSIPSRDASVRRWCPCRRPSCSTSPWRQRAWPWRSGATGVMIGRFSRTDARRLVDGCL
jgi:MFS family permease